MTNVAALKGGWGGWQRAGYGIETAPTSTPVAVAPPGTGEDEGGTALGLAGAPVTILEFSDFQ